LKYAFDEINTSRKDIAFTILDTLLYDDLLSAIDISWKLDNGDELDLNRLSEGQKQIVLTLGANYVFEEDKNLLYLFDEPDVFLHPQWQQKYVSMFQSYNELSHVIITTHNPILIGNLQKEQIHEINNGKTVDSNNFSYGRDVNSILEDYFKVKERNSQGKELIRNFYNFMDAKKYDEAEEYLNKLKENFGPQDVSTVRAESFFDDLAE
jgi:ABC-type multidrug transport system ATPase subunit